jgi:CubicO group peptidase (beta-lactamase class C family)
VLGFLMIQTLSSDPGIMCEYCNVCFDGLHHAIEKTSDLSAVDYFRTELFKPFGITEVKGGVPPFGSFLHTPHPKRALKADSNKNGSTNACEPERSPATSGAWAPPLPLNGVRIDEVVQERDAADGSIGRVEGFTAFTRGTLGAL